jgi:mono/diheme cytochrome c family protein
MRSGALIGAAGALLVAGMFGVAFAQSGAGVDDESTAAAAVQAGPPPMPQPVTMAQRPGATGGEALYVEHCAMCHGPNGMGTGLLSRRMDVALLEERDNLPAQYVIQAARRGIGNMPAIPRGEVSDEQLQAIAEYLAAGPHPRANPQPLQVPQ